MVVQALKLPRAAADDLDWAAGRRADRDVAYAVEQHLYEEAAMLDERRYGEWFATLADELTYYVPTRYAVSHRDLRKELAAREEAAHFDDTKATIKVRIKRLDTNMAWAESPASRVRRFVTNVSVRAFNGTADVVARSSLMLLKYRHDRDLETFSAARYDRLRPAGEAWSLVSRVGVVDQTVILTSNLSFFVQARVVDRIRACGVDELEPGDVVRVEADPPIAVYNVDGEFFATADTCTHGQSSLAEGWVDGDEIECAWHMARFCIRTGRARSLPATVDLRTYRVEVDGGDVFVLTDDA